MGGSTPGSSTVLATCFFVGVEVRRSHVELGVRAGIRVRTGARTHARTCTHTGGCTGWCVCVCVCVCVCACGHADACARVCPRVRVRARTWAGAHAGGNGERACAGTHTCECTRSAVRGGARVRARACTPPDTLRRPKCGEDLFFFETNTNTGD